MFTVTEPLVLLDYFRVPIERAEPARGLASETQRAVGGSLLASVRPNVDLSKALYWVPVRGDVNGHVSGAFTTDGIPTFCRVLPDEAARTSLESLGGKWHRSRPVPGPRGGSRPSGQSRPEAPVRSERGHRERYLSERYAEFIGVGTGESNALVRALDLSRLRPGFPMTTWCGHRWFNRLQSGHRFQAGPSSSPPRFLRLLLTS